MYLFMFINILVGVATLYYQMILKKWAAIRKISNDIKQNDKDVYKDLKQERW